MTTIFELSADDLFSLVITLKPNIDKDKIEREDVASLQSKVTEWLLLNGLSTLHKFTKNGSEWSTPPRADDCESCRHFKMQHKFIPSVVVNQPLATGENLVTFDVKSKDSAVEQPPCTPRSRW
uniref:Ubiquitinyl hydrolase 1 n=1 Tax=Heterorhabditis bacteriophora TaxID=37862 RepID=A0A1I7XSV1_HETBA